MQRITRRDAFKAAAALVAIPTTVTAHDPLIKAIQDYRDGVARFMAVPESELTLANEEETIERCYGAQDRALDNWDQPALTREGAIEALRFMEEQDVFIDNFGEPMRRAVLLYLERIAR